MYTQGPKARDHLSISKRDGPLFALTACTRAGMDSPNAKQKYPDQSRTFKPFLYMSTIL